MKTCSVLKATSSKYTYVTFILFSYCQVSLKNSRLKSAFRHSNQPYDNDFLYGPYVNAFHHFSIRHLPIDVFQDMFCGYSLIGKYHGKKYIWMTLHNNFRCHYLFCKRQVTAVLNDSRPIPLDTALTTNMV